MTEQRYDAVLGVISEGRTAMEVAGQWGVSRRTLHRWLARYEADGLEGLPDRSHRPERCPHQMPAEVEVLVLELTRSREQRSQGVLAVIAEVWEVKEVSSQIGVVGDFMPAASWAMTCLMSRNH